MAHDWKSTSNDGKTTRNKRVYNVASYKSKKKILNNFIKFKNLAMNYIKNYQEFIVLWKKSKIKCFKCFKFKKFAKY